MNIDSTTYRVMHAHGFLPFSQEADVLQFTILLHVYTDNGNALGKNNSGFRQRRLVNLIRGVLPPLIERLCFS